MAETFWSLPMAVAWLAYRTPEAVRGNWNAYRAACTHWIFRKTRIGFQGAVEQGYFLDSLRPSGMTRLRVPLGYSRSTKASQCSIQISAVPAMEINIWPKATVLE